MDHLLLLLQLSLVFPLWWHSGWRMAGEGTQRTLQTLSGKHISQTPTGLNTNSVCVFGGRGSREVSYLTPFQCVFDTYLHPFHRIGEWTGLVDEVCMLHVFGESLQEAQRLIKYHWHGDLGQFLFHKKMETVMSHRLGKLTCCHIYLTCSWEGSNRKQ